MATVVISQFIRAYGDQFFIKGTVDGNDHMMTIRGKFLSPADNPGSQVAELFANDYYLIRNAVAQNFQGVTYPLRVLDNKTATIVFSGTLGQVWSEAGYGMLEFTATVNGVSTKVLVRTDEFLHYAYSGGRGKVTVADMVAQRLYAAYMDELQGYGQYTSTFSGVSTTSSSTTTTTTTSTTTTTTTT